ncbi:MAG: hypothetical protein GY855_10875, partial [candidate division Zixibacteria bacterium]|nr:hypothetical protein [candidate division Zixibacteria bacterium]
CRGGVVELTIGYFGTVASFIEVYEGNHTNPDKLLYEGNVSPEDSFTFVGKQHHNKMGREISLYIDGGLNVKIHTSCSKPIGPGLIAGDFVVLGGVSKDGGPLCPVENGGGDEGWCELGKPMVLTVRYTGQECAFSNHSQNPDKVECDGDPAFESPVRILVIDKANPDDNRAKVWFDGQVELDALFDIDARNGGDSKLKAETHVFIYDLNDNLLQYLEFHTSCSQILEEGDQFGSLVLVDFTPEVRR